MTPRSEWQIARIAIVALFVSIIVRVSIPDYPYDWPLWYSLCMDPNGYWHEAFYIVVGLLALLDLTYWWEERLERRRTRCRRVKRS